MKTDADTIKFFSISMSFILDMIEKNDGEFNKEAFFKLHFPSLDDKELKKMSMCYSFLQTMKSTELMMQSKK
jgi:hypothetical protein